MKAATSAPPSHSSVAMGHLVVPPDPVRQRAHHLTHQQEDDHGPEEEVDERERPEGGGQVAHGRHRVRPAHEPPDDPRLTSPFRAERARLHPHPPPPTPPPPPRTPPAAPPPPAPPRARPPPREPAPHPPPVLGPGPAPPAQQQRQHRQQRHGGARAHHDLEGDVHLGHRRPLVPGKRVQAL